MNKTNGYSFADNEAPKVKSDEAASLADKIAGSFAILMLLNGFIWSPVFIVDSLMAKIVAGSLSAVVSIVVTYFIIKYLKKHWNVMTRCNYRSTSGPYKSYESAATSLKYSNVRGNVYNRTMR